jgi:hypothetical protein
MFLKTFVNLVYLQTRGDKMIWTIILVGLAACVGFFSSYMLKSDNPLEEKCEEIIKEQTGLDIDLTPGSKEENG